jgi:hypothetical protein
MRKLVLLAAVVAMVSTAASAGHPVGSFALGWVDKDAPIGIRYQLAEKIAADVGIGFKSYASDSMYAEDFEESDIRGAEAGRTELVVHIGLPMQLLEHDRCSLDFRPAFTLRYNSFDEDTWFTYDDDTEKKQALDSVMDFYLHGWLAFNIMLTDNLGLNAAHGINVEVLGEMKSGSMTLADGKTNIYSGGFDATEIGLFYWF